MERSRRRHRSVNVSAEGRLVATSPPASGPHWPVRRWPTARRARAWIVHLVGRAIWFGSPAWQYRAERTGATNRSHGVDEPTTSGHGLELPGEEDRRGLKIASSFLNQHTTVRLCQRTGDGCRRIKGLRAKGTLTSSDFFNMAPGRVAASTSAITPISSWTTTPSRDLWLSLVSRPSLAKPQPEARYSGHLACRRAHAEAQSPPPPHFPLSGSRSTYPG